MLVNTSYEKQTQLYHKWVAEGRPKVEENETYKEFIQSKHEFRK